MSLADTFQLALRIAAEYRAVWTPAAIVILGIVACGGLLLFHATWSDDA